MLDEWKSSFEERKYTFGKEKKTGFFRAVASAADRISAINLVASASIERVHTNTKFQKELPLSFRSNADANQIGKAAKRRK